MGDTENINKLLSAVGDVQGTLKSISNEQHEIKRSIDKIDKKLEITSKETTQNQEKINALKEQFKEHKEETEKRIARIYENMDKKEIITMNKVKVWTLGGVISGAIILIGFYISIKG